MVFWFTRFFPGSSEHVIQRGFNTHSLHHAALVLQFPMCPMQQICLSKKIQKSPETNSQDSPQSILIKLCFQRERVHTIAHKKGSSFVHNLGLYMPCTREFTFFLFLIFQDFFSLLQIRHIKCEAT